MSRVNLWALLCLMVTALFFYHGEAEARMLYAMWTYLGIPLALHWLFEPKEVKPNE